MFYWPEKTPDTLDGWVSIFFGQGYEQCNSKEIEPGFEKIAVYISFHDLQPSHVAYSDGIIWKSKLGRQVDIEHDSLHLLEGDQADEYGIVECVLKRPISIQQGRKRKAKN